MSDFITTNDNTTIHNNHSKYYIINTFVFLYLVSTLAHPVPHTYDV